MNVLQALCVAAGGAVGALARYGILCWWPLVPGRLPVATLTANVLGCCAIGALYIIIVERGVLTDNGRLFVMTGLLGALTTFSTFSLESIQLFRAEAIGLAIGYILLSVALSLGATALAMALTYRLIH